MKKITLIIAALVLILASCTKNLSKPASQQLTYSELSSIIGSENSFKCFQRAGLTESDPTARGGQRVKANAALTTEFDLTLTKTDSLGNVNLTLSPNAQWVGANNGIVAEWDCNRYYSLSEQAPPSINCFIRYAGSGDWIGFTSDKDYTVHISNKVTF